jgi:hypothetical protein
VTLDFDANNRLLGIELLVFSRLVPDEVRCRAFGAEG